MDTAENKLCFETINGVALQGLQTAKLPPTYTLSSHRGACCFLDPPGYPSYFVQHVYTRFGNTPPKGPTVVLCLPLDAGSPRIISRAEEASDRLTDRAARYAKIFQKLPLDHPRTEAWLLYIYAYYKNSYQKSLESKNVADLKFATPGIIPGCSENWPIDLYRPVTYIREWYPDFEHRADLVDSAWGENRSWWEREASPDA